MKGTTRGVCDRCIRVKSAVIASGFNEDGSFRMLCSSCDGIERWHHQRRLFEFTPRPVFVEVEEPEEIAPPAPEPQMSLFGGGL